MKYLLRYNRLGFYMFYILPLFFMVSCVKETIDFNKVSNTVNWNPKVGAPVAYGNFSLKDLISTVDSSGFIKEYPDSMLYFDYTSNLYSKTAGKIISLPDQFFTESFSSSNADFPVPVSGIIDFTRTQNYTFSFNNGAVLDTINIKSGNLIFNVSSSLTDLGWILITVPTLTKNGSAFQEKIVINDSTGNYSSSSTNDISGYSLTTLSPAGNVNEVPFSYEVHLQGNSQPPSSQNINVDLSIKNLHFNSMFGYVGQYSILDTSSVFKFNFFNNTSNLNVIFENPRLHLNFSNSFGLPVRTQLSNVYTQSKNTNTDVPLLFDSSVNPHDLKYPSNAELGQSIQDSLIIDSTTCANLPRSLAIYPQYLFYTVSAAINSSGPAYNFVTDSSTLGVVGTVELPLYMKAEKYEKVDTIGFNIGSAIPDSGVINQLVIHCAFQNGIPVDLQSLVFLTDSNYVHIDTLFVNEPQPIIKSATIDSNGKVIAPSQQNISINFIDPQKIENLKKVKYAIMQTVLSTTGNGSSFIKLYSYYRLNVKFGVEIGFKVNSLNHLP